MSLRRTNKIDDNDFYEKAIDAINLAKSPAVLENTTDPSALIVKELTKRLFDTNNNLKGIQPPAYNKLKRKIKNNTTASNKINNNALSANDFNNANDNSSELPFKYLLNLLSAAAPGMVKKENPLTKPNYTYTSGLHERNDGYLCTICGDSFKSLAILRKHEKNHKPKQPNICSQCGKGFARKDALKRHYNTMICQRNRAKFLSLRENLRDGLEKDHFK